MNTVGIRATGVGCESSAFLKYGDVTESGNYSIDARLRFENTTVAAGSLSMGLGINFSNPKSALFMDTGIHEITLYFSGRSIYEAGRNGNYTLHVILNRPVYWRYIYWSIP